MPFLPPNQQRQSTEGKSEEKKDKWGSKRYKQANIYNAENKKSN